MSSDGEVERMATAMCEVGQLAAAIVPAALSLARRHARKVLGPNVSPGHIEHAAHRIVSLVLITNGFLLTEHSEPDNEVEECLRQNITLAKAFIKVGQAGRRAAAKEEDEKPEPEEASAWLNTEQLRKMFESEESN
jgi:hypothetical protein